MVQHVFIVGCKGIPANYGGFETFVEELTGRKISRDIQYHVACAVENKEEIGDFKYNGALCHRIAWKHIGSARAIFYDLDALSYFIKYAKENKIDSPIFYVLACRIGPFVGVFKKAIHAVNGKLFVNPDGHEWKRAKWSPAVRKYWKYSEKLMVKHADLLVCDSKNIEKYIQSEYSVQNSQTTYIAYGADLTHSSLDDWDESFSQWLVHNNLSIGQYYLVVGRFVPENNYETMIREFMESDTKRDLVFITAVDSDFLAKLEKRTHFSRDKRIKFAGTVYDRELLKKIRESAFAYLHGHEVGGTNPSLIEALAATKLNLLLDVGFNREVAENGALYWSKDNGSLASVIKRAEMLSINDIRKISNLAVQRISEKYSWEYIVSEYEKLFLKGGVKC